MVSCFISQPPKSLSKPWAEEENAPYGVFLHWSPLRRPLIYGLLAPEGHKAAVDRLDDEPSANIRNQQIKRA